MGRILSTLSDALLPLVIVRLLGKAEVGVLGSVLLVYQTVALILATDLPNALMYFMPGRPEAERRALAVQQARVLFGFGVIAALLLAATGLLGQVAPEFAAKLFSSDSPALLRGGLGHISLLALFPLGDLPARMLPNLLVIENRTQLAARFAVAKSIGNAVFVLLPASLGVGIAGLLISYSAFGLLQGLALLYFLREIYRGVPRTRSSVSLLEVFRFVLPLGITDVVGQVANRIDRYMVSAAFPAAAFAEYHVGAFQIPVLTTIAYSVGMAYTPHFTELFREQRAKQAIELWRRSIEKVALIVLPCSIVFVVAAEPFIELLFTSDYARSASVFRWYALITLGRVATFGSVLVAAGQPRYVLRSAVATLLLNAGFSWLGLSLWGFAGPAIGIALAFVPMATAYCHYIAKATGLRLSETFPLLEYLKLLALACLAGLPAWLFSRWVQLPALLSIAATAGIVLGIFVALGWLTGRITRADFEYLRQWVRV